MLFSWGRRPVQLGFHDSPCDECGGRVRLTFVYRYFGLFWLGFATEKKLIGECIACGTGWEFDRSVATNKLVAWNYRFGWAILLAIIVVSVVVSSTTPS